MLFRNQRENLKKISLLNLLALLATIFQEYRAQVNHCQNFILELNLTNNIDTKDKYSLITNNSLSFSSILTFEPIDYNQNIFESLQGAFNVRFKQACLIPKALLYNDGMLQIGNIESLTNYFIGTKTQLQENILYVTLSFINKSQSRISRIQIKFNENSGKNKLFTNNRSNVHKRARVILSDIRFIAVIKYSFKDNIQKNPLSNIKFYGELYVNNRKITYFRINTKQETVILGIPCSINKFFNFQAGNDDIPTKFSYNSKCFMYSFANNLQQILPNFNLLKDNSQAYAMATLQKSKFQLLITLSNSGVKISMNIEPHNKEIVTTIISTFQGLLMKRKDSSENLC